MSDLMCDCNIIHDDIVSYVLENMINDNDAENLSDLFKILGDKTRIKILYALDKKEMCVCDIANVLNMTKSSVSHQLSILKRVSIVKYRREGKEVFYSLDDNHIKELFEVGLEHCMENKEHK